MQWLDTHWHTLSHPDRIWYNLTLCDTSWHTLIHWYIYGHLTLPHLTHPDTPWHTLTHSIHPNTPYATSSIIRMSLLFFFYNIHEPAWHLIMENLLSEFQSPKIGNIHFSAKIFRFLVKSMFFFVFIHIILLFIEGYRWINFALFEFD